MVLPAGRRAEASYVTNRPSTRLDDREIPPRVADALRIAFGFDDPPATLGEWAEGAARLLEENDVEVGLEEMCTATASRHEARIGDEVQHFHCVLDALLLPFVLEGEYDVESRCPVSDETIGIQVSRDDVEVTPPDAVMSFGVERDVRLRADDAVSPAFAYEHLCPYINAFRSREEYERWAADVPEAVTMGFPLTDGFVLASILEERPTRLTE